MEMQLFILGHVILLAIGLVCSFAADGGNVGVETLLGGIVIFIPLEIIYWVLHWSFV